MTCLTQRLTTVMPNLYLSVYLAGYRGTCPPRWVRRRLARTELHRAWLAGFMGIYTDSRRRGVCDRATFRFRKAVPCR